MASGLGTYPEWSGHYPPDGPPDGPDCGHVQRLGWTTDGPEVVCGLHARHPSSHAGYVPTWGRRRVDLLPEYGGADAGSVHMRALVIWDTPDA